MANIDKITEIIKNKYAEWEANPKRFESGYDGCTTKCRFMLL
jgi:hypothetical protein